MRARTLTATLSRFAEVLGEMRSEGGDQGIVDLWSAGDDMAALLVFIAGEGADTAAGFLDKQRSRGGVPGAQADFPEAIGAARGHISEIERRGTGTANACR